MLPPLAVSVVLPPVHIVFVPEIPATGRLLTVTSLVALAKQPEAVVTVTVYVVFITGFIEIAAVVAAVFQR